MAAHAPFSGRCLKLCYWNADARVVDAGLADLETHLARLGDVKVETVKALEDAAGADLLIVAAQRLSPKEFANWLAGFRRRIAANPTTLVWTPALILADAPFDVLSGIWAEVTHDNWYFDILAPAHAASLPIRVANLLRIHDHLHELKRYSRALEDINTKVMLLESQMQGLRGQGGGEGRP